MEGTLRGTLRILATVLTLVTAGTVAARAWWFLDLLTHFRVQYIAAALVLSVLALPLRERRVVAVMMVVAAIHAAAVQDLWLGGDRAPPAGGRALRVASANVYDPNPTPGKVLDFVRASDADIVVLVDAEAPRWRPVLAGIGALYAHAVPEGWSGGAPIVLFSRHPILAERPAEPPRKLNPFVRADIAVGGQTVTVIGVHARSPTPYEGYHTHLRDRQLRRLAEVVREERGPVIVAGDLNLSPGSPRFGEFLAEAGLNAARGQGWIGTWPQWFWPARVQIDHVLAKGPIALEAIGRGPGTGSDHFPVVANLRLPGGRLPETRAAAAGLAPSAATAATIR
jgi:endonuclease/exonuclease/phosphatase (EEP) superfamily protein YafD